MVGCLLHIMKEPLVHDYNDCILSYFVWLDLQLNLSTTATLETEESGHCKEVAIVERLKQERMYGLSATENGRCREVALSAGSTVHVYDSEKLPRQLPLPLYWT